MPSSKRNQNCPWNPKLKPKFNLDNIYAYDIWDLKPERCFYSCPCDDSLSCIFFGSFGLKGSKGWWFWLETEPKPIGLVPFCSWYLAHKKTLEEYYLAMVKMWIIEDIARRKSFNFCILFPNTHTHTTYWIWISAIWTNTSVEGNSTCFTRGE